MPLDIETVSRENRGDYFPDPEGEIVQVIRTNRHPTGDELTLLTRVEHEPPIDPSEHNVPDIEDALAEFDWSTGQLEALLEAEVDGENRTTACRAIEDAITDQ